MLPSVVSRDSLTAAQDPWILVSAGIRWAWGSELPLCGFLWLSCSPALSFFGGPFASPFPLPNTCWCQETPFNNTFPSLQLSPGQHDLSWVLHLCTPPVAQDQSRVTSEPTPYLTRPLCALQLLERALLEGSMKGNTRQWQRTFHLVSPREEPD